MRFRTIVARRYRNNGHVVVAKDPKTSYYDVYILKSSGQKEVVFDTPNRQVAVQEAKRVAMEQKYDFNPDTDLIY